MFNKTKVLLHNTMKLKNQTTGAPNSEAAAEDVQELPGAGPASGQKAPPLAGPAASRELAERGDYTIRFPRTCTAFPGVSWRRDS